MKITHITTLLLALSVGVTSISCRARYGTVRKNGGQGAEDKGSETPPIIEPNKPSASPSPVKPASQLPTAGLEAYVNGNIVTSVVVGTNVVLRPTASTIDPDNADVTDCDNDGIVEAAYSIEGGSTPLVVKRNGSCTPLSTSMVFDSVGTIRIQLKVKSDEAEEATAELTLIVAHAVSGQDQLPNEGFRIEADPLLTDVNSPIKFKAFCVDNNNVRISWDFADGKSDSGLSPSHPFASAGQFVVKATCTRDESTFRASVSVSIRGSSNEPSTGSGSGTGAGSGSGKGSGSGSGTGTGSKSGSGTGTGTGSVVPKEDPGQSDPGQRPNQN